MSIADFPSAKTENADTHVCFTELPLFHGSFRFGRGPAWPALPLFFTEDFANGVDDLSFARNKMHFKRGACGHWRKRGRHAENRTIGKVKSVLRAPAPNLRADSSLLNGFVDDDKPAGFLD